MIDVITVSIVLSSISTVTAVVVGFLHYSDRKDTVSIRNEQSKNVYAKADIVSRELTNIRDSIDTQLHDLKVKTEELDNILNEHLVDDAKVSQKVDNLADTLEKLEDKLDRIHSLLMERE